MQSQYIEAMTLLCLHPSVRSSNDNAVPSGRKTVFEEKKSSEYTVMSLIIEESEVKVAERRAFSLSFM